MTVITRKEIELSKKTTVLEILRDVPGITITQNGPAGSTASIHVRGGNAAHTLVMMDGVELNDLFKLNNLHPGEHIHPGQQILISSGSSSSSRAAASGEN